MLKLKKSKLLSLSLAFSIATSAFGNTYVKSHAEEENKVSIESKQEEKKDDKKAEDNKKENSKEDVKKDQEKKLNDSIAKAVEEESNTLSDNSVYKIELGYQFKDGSFDVWAEGSGFLITNKDIMTNQTLTDLSTSSSLYKRILEDKQAAYEKVGVSLNDEKGLKENLKIRVFDINGEQKSVSSVTSKNGMGVISLDNPESNPIAIFSDKENVEKTEGKKYNFKLANSEKNKINIQQSELEVVKNDDSNSENSSVEMKSSLEKNQSPLGSPIINDQGHVIGMVSGSGETVTVIPSNALQTFLATNSIPYLTASALKEKKDELKEKEEKKQAQDAINASIDTGKLEDSIKKAEAINKEDYTEESIKGLDNAVNNGKNLLKTENKTQKQVDKAYADITKANEELVEKPKLPIKLIVIAIAGLVFIILLISLIRKNRKTSKVKEKEKPETKEDDKKYGYSEILEEEINPNPYRKNKNYNNPNSNGFGIEDDDYIYRDDDDGDEGTTLLSGGYLLRRDNGKEIRLTDNFLIGKKKSDVDYCITNNSTVSRHHARVMKIDGDYYLEDLGSKNYTYVNGEQIPAHKKIRLYNNTNIKFSNVDFTFYSK